MSITVHFSRTHVSVPHTPAPRADIDANNAGKSQACTNC